MSDQSSSLEAMAPTILTAKDGFLGAFGDFQHMRRFHTTKNGKVVTCDTSEHSTIVLNKFVACTEEDNPHPLLDVTKRRVEGGGKVIQYNKVNLDDSATKAKHEQQRYGIMFARGQDACRELLILLPNWIASLKELKSLCKTSPSAIVQDFESDKVAAIFAFADKKTDANEGEPTNLDNASLFSVIDVCLQKAQQELNKLISYASTITGEVRKIEANPATDVPSIAAAAKKVVRGVIKTQEVAEEAIAQTKAVLAMSKKSTASPSGGSMSK
jgi:hypothetical protein